jgi:hypothetical protein
MNSRLIAPSSNSMTTMMPPVVTVHEPSGPGVQATSCPSPITTDPSRRRWSHSTHTTVSAAQSPSNPARSSGPETVASGAPAVRVVISKAGDRALRIMSRSPIASPTLLSRTSASMCLASGSLVASILASSAAIEGVGFGTVCSLVVGMGMCPCARRGAGARARIRPAR